MGHTQDPEGLECLLERRELGPQYGVDTLARLVAGPHVVAEGLDHVVGGHADVGGAVAEHGHHRGEHAAHGRDLGAVGPGPGRRPKKWRNSS